MEEEKVRSWTRENGWRQGHVFPAEAAAAFGLFHPANANDTCIVVISHDCDLANTDLDAEPNVEVIVGRRIPAANGSLTRTKSPRRLHLELQLEGATVAIDLMATAKALVPKSRLAEWTPDSRYQLNQTSLETLRHWLAVRYKRAAFPDEFDRRMRDVTKVADRIEKVLRDADAVVSAVYFRLDTLEELATDDPTPYVLEVFLAYEPGIDPESNGDRADAAAEAIREAFRQRCMSEDGKTWQYVKLKYITPISEDDITVSQAKRLQQWRLEHLSLKAGAESAAPLDLKT